MFAAGLMYFLLVDYLVCLAAETWLAATQMQDTTPSVTNTPIRRDDTHHAAGIS